MQTLGEMRYAFIIIPLLFVFIMYMFTGNAIALLGTNFLLALISATIIAVITAEIPLTGNSEGTYLAFTVGFALAFWGLSIAGFSGVTSGVALWADSIASFLEGRPSYQQMHPNGTSLDVSLLNSLSTGLPNIGGWSGATLWGTLMIVLSFMYCLGLYFMVTSRGH